MQKENKQKLIIFIIVCIICIIVFRFSRITSFLILLIAILLEVIMVWIRNRNIFFCEICNGVVFSKKELEKCRNKGKEHCFEKDDKVIVKCFKIPGRTKIAAIISSGPHFTQGTHKPYYICLPLDNKGKEFWAYENSGKLLIVEENFRYKEEFLKL